MRQLTLREHQPTRARITSEQHAGLVAAIPSLDVTPTNEPGVFVLRPGAHVGTVVVPDLTVHITPKVGAAPTLFMLAYTLDPKHWREHYTTFAAAEQLLESFVPAFLTHLRRALRPSPLQGYRTVESAEPTVRGRLRFDDQLRDRHGRTPPAEVRYDEFTVDTDLNRILKAAIVRLGKLPLRNRELAHQLRRAEHALADVRLIRYHPARLPEVSFDRLTARYRHAIALARLVLRDAGIEHRHGTAPSTAFLVDMNQLFEDFVATAIREHLNLSTTQFPQNAQRRHLVLDHDSRIRLAPDLSWWEAGHCRFVGDVKYKAIHAPGIRHPDLYQLLAYTTAIDLREGLLVYAAGEATPTNHDITHTNKRLRVRVLDIASDPHNVLADIRSIADEIKELYDTATVPRFSAG